MDIGKISSLIELMGGAPLSPLSPRDVAQQRLLIRAVESANESNLFGDSTAVTFSYDRTSKRTVVQIVDLDTKEVLRQLPAEELLRRTQELESTEE